MGAEQIAVLVATYGIPFVEYLIGLIENKTTVTTAEWANLKALASVGAKSELLTRLQAAGIDPASPRGQSLLGLVSDSLVELPVASPSAPESSGPTSGG